jgi:hypothetical protein
MSQENVDALRGARVALRPLRERAARRRTLDERFFVRFPALYRRQAGAFWRATRQRPGLRDGSPPIPSSVDMQPLTAAITRLSSCEAIPMRNTGPAAT